MQYVDPAAASQPSFVTYFTALALEAFDYDFTLFHVVMSSYRVIIIIGPTNADVKSLPCRQGRKIPVHSESSR